MDVWRGGVGAGDVSWWKIVENFESLLKILNILKQSIQIIQNSAFSQAYLYLYLYTCMLIIRSQMYF